MRTTSVKGSLKFAKLKKTNHSKERFPTSKVKTGLTILYNQEINDIDRFIKFSEKVKATY